MIGTDEQRKYLSCIYIIYLLIFLIEDRFFSDKICPKQSFPSLQSSKLPLIKPSAALDPLLTVFLQKRSASKRQQLPNKTKPNTIELSNSLHTEEKQEEEKSGKGRPKSQRHTGSHS